MFKAASEILKYNKENIRKKGKRFYLLGGMIFCSVCERVYNSQTIRFNKPYPHSQSGYRHRKSQGHCSNKWISSHKIEPVVWAKVVEILLDPASLRRGYERMIKEEGEKQSRQIKHVETLRNAAQKLQAKRTRLQAVYLDPDIGMSKEEYLYEKKALDEQMEVVSGDIERIEVELAQIPTLEGLENLEEMASGVRALLGTGFDISDTDKRNIMEMLNLKVWMSPDRKIKVEGWFTPQNGLLDTSWWSQRNHSFWSQRLQSLISNVWSHGDCRCFAQRPQRLWTLERKSLDKSYRLM